MCVAQNIISLAYSFIGNGVSSRRSSKNASSGVFWVFLFLDKPTSEGRALIFSGTNYNYNWWIFAWLTFFSFSCVDCCTWKFYVSALIHLLLFGDFEFNFLKKFWFPYFTVTLVNKIHRCRTKLFFVTQ